MSESVLRSGMPQSAIGLRDLLTAWLPQGFAKSVQPIASTVITTDDKGLVAGEVKLVTRDGPVPAYRAMPDKNGKFPVILVVQEIFGVHEHIKDICRRLAHRGYFAIAPELYVRQGDPRQYTDIPTLLREVVSKVPDEQVMRDFDACFAYAAAHAKADAKRTGITGFCYGGRIVWLYCAHSNRVKAGVAWYGRLVGAATPLTPRHPIDIADQLAAPVLGLYGGADQGIPLDTVERMRAALRAFGKGHESSIHVYDGAPHAFNADYRPSYRKEAAEDGWQRMLDWFRKHGVA